MCKTNRRDFLKSIVVGGGVFAVPHSAHAVLPLVPALGWAAHFVVGMGLRRVTTRALLTASSSRRLENLVVAGVVVGASREAASQIVKYSATAIWSKDGHDNPFTFVVRNASRMPQGGNVYCDVVDVETGRVEHTKPLAYFAALNGSSSRAFVRDFVIADLPNTGVKRLVGRADSPHIKVQPSEPFYVASEGEVRRT